ncbi:rifin [Plasmodium sp. gorilla clade G1]|nr:rifin [Plasmodium sp. gorilla clade G1]
MKPHYFNILLFFLPLNIFLLSTSQVNVRRNHYSITLHTSKTPKPIKSNRSLCECDLYKPNYDNDPEMINLMENFNKQTQQRFHEYDEHINEKRQKCKEQCEKDIQKIILKDKIEKELTDRLAALDTNIATQDISPCVCEKSIADKVEKNCLKCGGILGTALPELALLGGISSYMLTNAAPSAAIEAGMKAAVAKLNDLIISVGKSDVDLKLIVTKSSYNCASALYQNAKNLVSKTCGIESFGKESRLCNTMYYSDTSTFNAYAEAGTEAYNKTLISKTAEIISFNNAMIASIIAIVVIVLVMVIIYLILRYRRKKKMKKKLQYIKLLNQ